MVAGCVRQVVILYRNDCNSMLVFLDEWLPYRVSHLRLFSSDTAHSGVHIYTSVVKPVHISMATSRASKTV